MDRKSRRNSRETNNKKKACSKEELYSKKGHCMKEGKTLEKIRKF